MGSGFSKMRKQARQMEEQFTKMQEDMENMEVIGTAGNGLVEVMLNGSKALKKITINPDCVDPEDIEGLQDLILAAFQDAESKLADETPSLGGLPFGL